MAILFGYEYRAEILAAMGKWQDVLNVTEQQRQRGGKTGNLNLVTWAGLTSAQAYYGLGNLPTARKIAQKSLDIAESKGYRRLIILVAAQLAIIQTDLGQSEIAEETARNATERGDNLNNVHGLCASLGALAHWHMQHEEWEKAIEHFNRYDRVVAKTDNRYIPLVNGPRYAEARLRVGLLKEATEVVERTLILAREAPSPHIEALTRRVQAQIFAEQAMWDEAMCGFDEAIKLFERLGSRLEHGRALYHKGVMQAKCGNANVAQICMSKALEIFEKCSAKIDTDRTRTALKSLKIDVSK